MSLAGLILTMIVAAAPPVSSYPLDLGPAGPATPALLAPTPGPRPFFLPPTETPSPRE